MAKTQPVKFSDLEAALKKVTPPQATISSSFPSPHGRHSNLICELLPPEDLRALRAASKRTANSFFRPSCLKLPDEKNQLSECLNKLGRTKDRITHLKLAPYVDKEIFNNLLKQLPNLKWIDVAPIKSKFALDWLNGKSIKTCHRLTPEERTKLMRKKCLSKIKRYIRLATISTVISAPMIFFFMHP